MDNPYLICSDRELRIMPTQWLRTERRDRLGRILNALEFMEAKVGRLGNEQTIGELREVQVLLGQGQNVGNICRSFNICKQTYYCSRKEYVGIRTEQVRWLKELEKENA